MFAVFHGYSGNNKEALGASKSICTLRRVHLPGRSSTGKYYFCVKKYLTFPAVPSKGGKEEATGANGCNGSDEEALGTNTAMRPWGRRVSAGIELLNFASKNN